MPPSRSPIINSMVAIGRAMKGAEMFIESPSLNSAQASFSRNRLLDCALEIGFFGSFAVQHVDQAVGLQAVLAVNDHGFTGPETLVDQSFAVRNLSDRNRTHFRFAVRCDYVNIGAVRTLLHGAGRNGQAVRPRVEQQARVDELTGPQHALRIRKG